MKDTSVKPRSTGRNCEIPSFLNSEDYIEPKTSNPMVATSPVQWIQMYSTEPDTTMTFDSYNHQYNNQTTGTSKSWTMKHGDDSITSYIFKYGSVKIGILINTKLSAEQIFNKIMDNKLDGVDFHESYSIRTSRHISRVEDKVSIIHNLLFDLGQARQGMGS